VHSYHPWAAPFPSEFDSHVVKTGHVLLLSWAGTRTSEITSGRYDHMIRARAHAVRALPGRVLLRWRWEMNRPNLADEVGSPEEYVQAWRHLRQVFDEERVTNAEWVWCPLARDFRNTGAARYYPGDDEVDWLCADAYPPSPEVSLAAVLRPFFSWAEQRHKPIALAEFGIEAGAPGARARWLTNAERTVREHTAVKAALYYESDNAPAGFFGLSTEPSAVSAFANWSGDRYFTPPWARRYLAGGRRGGQDRKAPRATAP
jgi:hypothetical protein